MKRQGKLFKDQEEMLGRHLKPHEEKLGKPLKEHKEKLGKVLKLDGVAPLITDTN